MYLNLFHKPAAAKKAARTPGHLIRIGTICLLLATVFILLLISQRYPSFSSSLFSFACDASRSRSSIRRTVDMDAPAYFDYVHPIVISDDSSLPLSGVVVLLDPGHGGQDPGCIFPVEDPDFYESIMTLDIARRTKEELTAMGATVMMLRDDNTWVSLYHRLALVHLYSMQYALQADHIKFSSDDAQRIAPLLYRSIDINSDSIDSLGMGIMAGTGVGPELRELMNLQKKLDEVIFLSIHINANTDSLQSGTQLYYLTDASVIEREKTLAADPFYRDHLHYPINREYRGRDARRNEQLAQSLYDNITLHEPALATHPYPTLLGNYAVIREHNLAGALIEVGYLTNANDRKILQDDAALDRIAAGIASGVMNYFSG